MCETIKQLKERIIFLETLIDLNDQTIEKCLETNKLLLKQLKHNHESDVNSKASSTS